MTKRSSIAGALLACLPLAGAAAVTDLGPSGFSVRHEVGIEAPPETVWRMLTGHVGEWWSSDHTYSGAARNLYIELKPLGCFCERLVGDGAVVHLIVTFVDDARMLRLSGGLGPLGLMGVTGNMTWSLGATDAGTGLVLDYAVGGYAPDGFEEMAEAVDFVLGEQVERLRRFVETGDADPSL